MTAHDTQARVLPLILPPSAASSSDPTAAPDIVPLLVNYLPPPSGDKGGASVLFRLAQGRMPLVRVNSSGGGSSGGGSEGASSKPPTLKSYVDPAKAGSARLQRVEAAWRRTMLGLSGRAGAAFHRAWRETRASSLVCTAPGCGRCVPEEDGGLAALRAHVAAAHSAGGSLEECE